MIMILYHHCDAIILRFLAPNLAAHIKANYAELHLRSLAQSSRAEPTALCCVQLRLGNAGFELAYF